MMKKRRMPQAVRDLAELVAVRPDGGSFWDVDLRPMSNQATDLLVSVECTRPGTLRVLVLSGDHEIHAITKRSAVNFAQTRKHPVPPIVMRDRVIMVDVMPEDVAKLARAIANHEGRTVERIDASKATPSLSTQCASTPTLAGCAGY